MLCAKTNASTLHLFGTPSLFVLTCPDLIGSAAGPAAQQPRDADVTQIFIISGTSWTVPSDWSNTNTIETIGGGGGGGTPNSSSFSGSGGGGGGYSKISNLSGLNGSLTVQVGGGGAPDASGGDTWFNGRTLGTSSGGAKGGGAGDVGGHGGSGGDAASGIAPGGAKFSGGSGASVPFAPWTGGGGGGAAGPNGDGAPGGVNNGLADGAGGGGGNGGGSAGAAPSGSSGGTGGNGNNGTGAVPAIQDRVPATELPGPAAVAAVADIRPQITVEVELAEANSMSATGQAVVAAAAMAPPRGTVARAPITGAVVEAAGTRRVVRPGAREALAGTVSLSSPIRPRSALRYWRSLGMHSSIKRSAA